jgi:glycosyltransferase involved in cell wall biosynthesis
VKYRILLVADDFYPALGGAARVVGESGQALRQLGHEVWIVAGTDDARLPLQEEFRGVHIRRYRFNPKTTLHLNVTAIASSARTVRKIIRREGPFDLIHLHNVFGANGALAGRDGKALPQLSTFHGPAHHEFEVAVTARVLDGRPIRRALQPPFVRVYSRWLRFLQARVIWGGPCVVLSRYAGNLVREVAPGYPPGQIRVIPGGVDLRRFLPAADRSATRRALSLAPDWPLILTVRRLVPRMGLEALIEAFHDVKARYPGAHLVVGGAGPLQERLRRLAGALSLNDAVTFPGLLPEQMLAHYYQAADVFVLPSRALEGFGLITLEALACGTPVVATRVGGSPEILDALGKEFLVEHATPSDLAKGIIQTLDRQESDRTLRESCRSFVTARYSWERVARQLEAVYDEITTSRRSA